MAQNEDKTMFEKKIKPLLTYIGTAGAISMAIAYVVVICIMIIGFNGNVGTTLNSILFAIINAIAGFGIMQFLKIQGISFAKEIPSNKAILKEYYNSKTKDKKFKRINSYWITSTTKDVAIKCLTVMLSTVGLMYVIIKGSKDFTLLLLAAVNLLMFLSFGLLALNEAYEFYNYRHIPYIKDILRNNKISIKEINKCLQSMEKNIVILKNKS